MTEQVDPKVRLKQHVADLDRAIAEIAERRPHWDGQTGRWAESVYTRVRESVVGRGAPAGWLPSTSRLPGRLGHISWLVEVDQQVAHWSGLPGTTPARLVELRSRAWRIQDGDLLALMCTEIGRWVQEAAVLLGERELHAYLRGYSCPGCGLSHVQVGRNGDRRRVPALLADPQGVTCQNPDCGVQYPPERWGLLAAILTGA